MVKCLPKMRETGSIPGLGRSSGEGNSNPLEYSCLENLMTEECYRLQSMGSQRVRHNWATALLSLALPTKVHLVKAMVFPVVMYGCESWTIKKAECRIDAFELWCWRTLLKVPWTARRSNQSILKEISPGCSLEGLMLKLKLQYFGHLI